MKKILNNFVDFILNVFTAKGAESLYDEAIEDEVDAKLLEQYRIKKNKRQTEHRVL